MGFFSCLVGSKKLKGKKKCETSNDTAVASPSNASVQASAGSSVGDRRGKSPMVVSRPRKAGAASFSFSELAVASQNFRPSNIIGEGGFGKVFKGYLETGEAVAIKQMSPDGLQGSKEFLVEVLMLIVLRHRNLVNLIGFCIDGDEKLLVYEYLAKGSLEKHLFDLPLDKEPLEWNTRIKIALGAAKGLEYLHDMADPPVIYRDLKSANILLDEEFNSKLSDFGLAKLAPVGDKTHVSTRVMGTFGYCAPDYAMSGRLTVKSDIYSLGVVLLELITGRKAYDSSKGCLEEQNLIIWCRPFLSDRRKFVQLADPLLRGRFPLRQFHQVVVVTSMCLQEQPMYRPVVHDVVVALEHVASVPYIEADGGSSTPSPWFTPSPHDVNARRRTMN